jgi:hypothetical protein
MTPEELNASLARRDRADRRQPMSTRDQALMSAIGVVLVDEIERACKPLTERLAQLDKQIEKIERRKYVGVWAAGKNYEQGQFCTFDNSMWHCNLDGTEQRPGTGPDWTLAIKRGRDGKDSDTARRLPTQTRTYGNG